MMVFLLKVVMFGNSKKIKNFSKISTLDASNKYADVDIAQNGGIINLRSPYDLVSN